MPIPLGSASATSVGNLAIFAGGFTNPNSNTGTTVAKIYNTTTGLWSTANLSQPRVSFRHHGWKRCAVRRRRLHRKQRRYQRKQCCRYLLTRAANSWSTTTLSQGRDSLAATTVGNQALFAGGEGEAGNPLTVDIYTDTTPTPEPGCISVIALAAASFLLRRTRT